MNGLWPSAPLDQVGQDEDEGETQEWLESLQAVVAHSGSQRAEFLLTKLVDQAYRCHRLSVPLVHTAYVNTIDVSDEPVYPGDEALEEEIQKYNLWNLFAVVLRANRDSNVGGHIASYASAATLYNVGLLHFWRAHTASVAGDLVFFQGHSSPGLYAWAYMEERLQREQLECFRREAKQPGLSSYPHPWLMKHFWQFPTVSMGLAPLQAIYQARFMRYLETRDLASTQGRLVWAMLGDGEMDEPESLGAITVAGREKLDNLIFVVNCNLQRLDGPVRGNAKIIQELEGVFRGAGWHVIKVLWGSAWDDLLRQDHQGHLQRALATCLDGDFQRFCAQGTVEFAKQFFQQNDMLAAMVANWTDEQLAELVCGGHDRRKVYSAYHAAVSHQGQPIVLLMHTVKGFGMGESGEARNISHQQKKMSRESLAQFCQRFRVPLNDQQIDQCDFVSLRQQVPQAAEYLHARRQALGGSMPARCGSQEPIVVPVLADFASLYGASTRGSKGSSTTMSFVRILAMLLKKSPIQARIVPIVPDESRTFGMDVLFRQVGIWSSVGQLYRSEDDTQLVCYRESHTGQILQEGISEMAGLASWIAAATSYSVHNTVLIPFFIFYSMFGFQRIGDLIWSAADSRSRGFLLGATSGRTTLNGEGLQHADGSSQLVAALVPNCCCYDPTFAYEVVVIVQDGLRRMIQEQEDVFYYITLLNENYVQPALPEEQVANIVRGMYLFAQQEVNTICPPHHVQLLGCGSILMEVIAAAQLLAEDWQVSSTVWSCPSFSSLARDGDACERYNRLHPGQTPRVPFVTQCLLCHTGPVIAATDYVRAVPNLIRAYVPFAYFVLGTDGFGRSDTRAALRSFFEVDRYHIVVTALHALAQKSSIAFSVVQAAIERYDVAVDHPDPWTV